MNVLYVIFCILFIQTAGFAQNTGSGGKWAIAIHGGAGAMKKEFMSDDKQRAYEITLDEALEKASQILENGGSALDAVEKAITILEDSPLFNAGKGAVFNSDGVNELDASIMDGKTLNSGAVSNVTDIKNPILAARRVMTHSPHAMLSGKGASNFAKEQGLKIVDNSYFFTFDRWNEYQNTRDKEEQRNKDLFNIKGTVGCVALDRYGNLAAGTSTGGMNFKKPGRIGDSPIIGAGTYANNATCAVSCTGHGEMFIRYVVAYDVSALIEYRGLTLDKATTYIIHEKLVKAGAKGGLIAVDKDGNISTPFNTDGMFRAWKKSDNTKQVLIFKE